MLERTRFEAQLEIADLVSKCESYRLRLGEQLIGESNEENRNTHQLYQVFLGSFFLLNSKKIFHLRHLINISLQLEKS